MEPSPIHPAALMPPDRRTRFPHLDAWKAVREQGTPVAQVAARYGVTQQAVRYAIKVLEDASGGSWGPITPDGRSGPGKKPTIDHLTAWQLVREAGKSPQEVGDLLGLTEGGIRYAIKRVDAKKGLVTVRRPYPAGVTRRRRLDHDGIWADWIGGVPTWEIAVRHATSVARVGQIAKQVAARLEAEGKEVPPRPFRPRKPRKSKGASNA